MPFIGNQPALSYTSFAKQDFTTSATTSYTLDNPVANANELALFINFVRQEPTTAYSASGTSLTLTSATSASDDMYCVFLGKAVQTVNPPNASVGASQIVDASITSGKLASGVLPTNTPAFFATMSADQTGVLDSTFTKIQFDTERFDTDSAYDATTNYRFTVPTGKGGKYFFSSRVYIDQVSSSQTISSIDYAFYINGAQNVYSGYAFTNYNPKIYTPSVNAVLDLSAGDYVESYIRADTTSGATFVINQNTTTLARCFWYGYKLIT